MKKAILAMMIMTALLLFAGCSEKKEEQTAEDRPAVTETEQEDKDTAPEGGDTAPDGLLDFRDFTIVAPGYEYGKTESAEGGEARMYGKGGSHLCVKWEEGELSKDDYSNVMNVTVDDAEYSGLSGFEVIQPGQFYIFTFNINGDSWQIDCSDESDYYEIVGTIKIK